MKMEHYFICQLLRIHFSMKELKKNLEKISKISNYTKSSKFLKNSRLHLYSESIKEYFGVIISTFQFMYFALNLQPFL